MRRSPLPLLFAAALVLGPQVVRAHGIETDLIAPGAADHSHAASGSYQLHSAFSSGEPARNAAVRLLARAGAEPIELGRTDTEGRLAFVLPVHAGPDAEIQVDAGAGHRDWIAVSESSGSTPVDGRWSDQWSGGGGEPAPLPPLNDPSRMASTGSTALDRIVERLGSATDPKRRYEYVLWLAKRLEPLPEELRREDCKVRGCVSQVYVVGELRQGTLHWQGDSDAQITKGLLALLIEGMEGLTPAQVQAIDPAFIAATGLQASLTPSRANGFLNILRTMQAQAAALAPAADGS
jgi:cysteine desulfuration protein SufE